MKHILLIARILTGSVFIFSGFVKAIDPSGTAIKFEEYFLAFHLEFLSPAILPLAILLSTAEMMIGLNLLARIGLKFTAWLLLIFMSYFTILTFILALTNPVSDCGCFGDAIKLTNWQTFWKNIILLIPAMIIFIHRKHIASFSSPVKERVVVVLNIALPVMLSVYCLRHEPLLDFRPYKAGTSITEKMSIPENAPVDLYETILIYEKDGVQKEFPSDNYPWQDTLWKWVETRHNLISKGYEPPIHDFLITSQSGEDMTTQLLSDSAYVLLIIAPRLETASNTGMVKMNNLAMKADNLGFKTYCLTSSTNDEITRFKNLHNPIYEICSADETALKTILRSNPGLMILEEGTILAKYNFRDAPDEYQLKTNLISYIVENLSANKEKLTIFLLLFVLLYLYSIIAIPAYKKDT